ncbi:hypothetical protein BASA60_009113, partial [Batrachochytrium salamandrivorans]
VEEVIDVRIAHPGTEILAFQKALALTEAQNAGSTQKPAY